jgi:hypothetical protein
VHRTTYDQSQGSDDPTQQAQQQRAPRDIRRLNWQLEGTIAAMDELREMKESYESSALAFDDATGATTRKATKMSPGAEEVATEAAGGSEYAHDR